jgi:hypothetical protein
MAVTTEHHPQEPVPTDVLDGAVKPYSRDKVYVVTAIGLALITGLEVATYWVAEDVKHTALFAVALLFMAAVKFFFVASVFMHLRYDRKILTWALYSGVVLALLVYVAIMTVFRIWWPAASAIKHT